MMKAWLRVLFVWLLVGQQAFAVAVNGQLVRAQMEKLASDPTGTEARFYWNTTSKTSKVYNGTSWSSMGGSTSGSGVNNLITNGSFEDPVVTGWTYYDEGALAAPVDGTGDAVGANTLTAAAHSTTAAQLINGTGLMKLTKAASDGQGEGWSYDFTLPPKSQLYSSLVTLSFNYHMSTAATDMYRVYLYDDDLNTLITPQFVTCGGGTTPSLTGTTTTCHAELAWVSTTSDNYRLIFHVASATATAIDLYVDDIFTGEYKSAVGAAVGSPVSWTPTGTFSTNTTYTGTYQRFGNRMRGQIKLAFAGAPNSTTLTVNMPSGFTIDTTGMPTPTATSTYIGDVGFWDANVAETYQGRLTYDTTTVMRPLQFALTGTTKQSLTSITQTTPIVTIASGDQLTIDFDVPVAEWAGVTSFGENKVEYVAWNGSTTVYGPDGALVPTITAVGDNTTTTYTLALRSPIPVGAAPYIEIKRSDSTAPIQWVRVGSALPYTGYIEFYSGVSANRRNYGIGVDRALVANTLSVIIGNAGVSPGIADGTGRNWPVTAGDRYRVVIETPGAASGFGLADATNAGLVSATTQTLAGDKTLTDDLTVNGTVTAGAFSTATPHNFKQAVTVGGSGTLQSEGTISAQTVTMADAAVTSFTSGTTSYRGILFVHITSGGGSNSCIMMLRGNTNATAEMLDTSNVCSVTAGTAFVNVYYSAPNYRLQNLSGVTKEITLMFFNETTGVVGM